MTQLNIAAIFFISLFTSFACFAQNDFNPFEAFDPNTEVQSLSNGQYKEVFDTDSIEIIGSAILNTRTMKVIGFVEQDTMYSEATMEPEIVSRWLSTDPAARKYTDLSPYHFSGCNPIWYQEVDGAVFDFSNLSAQEKEQYDALIVKLSESDIFSYYYAVLDKSETVYTIDFDSDLPRGGQFNYKTNTVTLKSPEGRYTAAQELFHAFQTDREFYSPEGDRANIETEGDIAATYVLFQSKSLVPTADWMRPLLNEYGFFQTPDPEEVQSETFNDLFQGAVEERIEYYEGQNEQFNDFFKHYTTEKSDTKPKAIIKAVTESDQSLTGPRLENGDFYSQ